MARSVLTNIKDDLVEDSGAILWSLIRGEALEFEVKIDFVENIYDGYDLEASLIEAANVENQSGAPKNIRTEPVTETVTVPVINENGDAVLDTEGNQVTQQITNTLYEPSVAKNLHVRLPSFSGYYVPNNDYAYGDRVYHNGKIWELITGRAAWDPGEPDGINPYWIESDAQTIFIQFPEDVIEDWSVLPSVGCPVYGFFELRVTEQASHTNFKRTWKPVRGMVGFYFSPTAEVSDTTTVSVIDNEGNTSEISASNQIRDTKSAEVNQELYNREEFHGLDPVKYTTSGDTSNIFADSSRINEFILMNRIPGTNSSTDSGVTSP